MHEFFFINCFMDKLKSIFTDFTDLLKRIYNQGFSFFSFGDKRTVKAKKNIVFLAIMKIISIIVGLIQVPLILSYLSPSQFGIWLTLSSVVGWIVYFDIGLGNGLRNRFAEALAIGDTTLARIYVSTTYFIVSLITLAILFIFLSSNIFINWQNILNASSINVNDLNILVVIVIISFCTRFVFNLITTILSADQEPARAGMLEVTVNLASLLAVYILIKTSSGSLLLFGIVQCCITVVIPIVASLWYFSKRYRFVAPSFRFVKIKYIKPLANIGIQFFVLQIASLIVFSSSNILIANLLGTIEVTQYNIVFKYFSVASMFFGIIIAPFWSAFTEAYQKAEIEWILSSTRKLIAVWFIVLIITIIMLIMSDTMYNLWIGDKIEIPFSLSLAMALYVTISNWNYIFVSFLNGIGKIRLQLIHSIFIMIFNIPIAYVLVKYFEWGISGVVSATTFCLIIGSIFAPFQYRKLIRKTATGIWNK